MARVDTIDMELRRCEEELRKLGEVRGSFALGMETKLGAMVPNQRNSRVSTPENTTIWVPTGNGAVEEKTIPWVYIVDGGTKLMKDSGSGSDRKIQWLPSTYQRALTPKESEFIDGFLPFQEWKRKYDFPSNVYTLERIEIHSIDQFGAFPPSKGFLKFNAIIKKQPAIEDGVVTGKPISISGITFMRGASVAMLVLFKDIRTNIIYTILTVQARTPTGRSAFAEIPAGMMDDKKNFAGTAAKELQEECELKIPESALLDLTQYSRHEAIYLSPGGCDESMKFFLYQKEQTPEYIAGLQGKLTGNVEEDEEIKLKIIPFDDILWHCPDAKTIVAVHLYTCYLKSCCKAAQFHGHQD